MNKKGTIFTSNTLFVLTSLVGLGLIVLLIINPVLQGMVAPALLATTSGEMTSLLEPKYDFVLSMVKLLPYVLFAIAIIYLLVLIFRKEEVQYYG